MRVREGEITAVFVGILPVSFSGFSPMVGFLQNVADWGLESISIPFAVYEIGRFGM